MSDRSRYAAEIESLHEFFVEWYAGQRPKTDAGRLEEALAPGFEMVTPDGDRLAREAVLEGIREDYGRDEPGAFDIDIRNVEVVARTESHATVRYEECQETTDETTGRVSTVLFRDDTDAPGELAWVDLHETWLESPET
ncbi:DUF4440 domain-containing protein [Halobiforma nitratireducens]|uniref:Sucrose-phosphatase C-terminal domain-containing protein n=1 Tax=Halobiforma nitratireducens JCM 10879 TaxID=1227454 RepID=M0LTK7_9EURY|nr:DUF4440 domain-containing protein [Halobiforma nitratireducens]EMA35435.1 hypothetical protein C446_12599 [Halobiforma nitratireducens JCM 10879]